MIHKPCQELCAEVTKLSVGIFSQAAAALPSIPKYEVQVSADGKRKKYVDRTEPNWWQVPKPIWREILETDAGRAAVKSLEETKPFSTVIGRSICIVEKGFSISIDSAHVILGEIIKSYHFAGGAGRWNRRTFDQVWNDCRHYYDPNETKVRYVMYAPITGLSGSFRKLELHDGLVIRRLSPNRVAAIASLSNYLAGFSDVDMPLRVWTSAFLVQEFQFKKLINSERLGPSNFDRILDLTASVNEEAVVLRSLLNEWIAIPTFAFVYEGYPRDGWPGHLNLLPWRTRTRERIGMKFTSAELRSYRKNRRSFQSLRDAPGWGSTFASMRRFAVAWENPFMADSLADVVAALEALLVRENTEVGYKLRVRASNLLTRDPSSRLEIAKDIKDAYVYRSRIAHGDYVFDDIKDWTTAKALNRAKPRNGNPFHDINEVRRLRGKLTAYYRAALINMILKGALDMDWSKRGL